MSAPPITVAQSNAFVETFDLPPIGSGPLDGLSFAVKDLIDVAGFRTGCGNPAWKESHSAAGVHAVCVEQLLRAGGRCVGKSITDELAFSLLGMNHHYGTPLNPRAPERVPGGSSSGSASAVACGLVDFALGTDTGGSVRVPASNCGIWGFRPSHGFISVAGVMPFAPGLDTVGVFSQSAEVLRRAGRVLLGLGASESSDPSPPAPLPSSGERGELVAGLAPSSGERGELVAGLAPSSGERGELLSPDAIYLLRDAFALADAEVQEALAEPVRMLRERFGERVREISLRELAGDEAGASFSAWFDTFTVVQWAEIESCLGAWIASNRAALGPATAAGFDLVRQLDRGRIPDAVARRERFFRRLQQFLGPRDLLCLPTTPALAPRKDHPPVRTASSGSGYFPRTLSLTSVAGIGRLPQVSLPLAWAGHVPVGLSLLGRHGEDAFLMEVAKSVSEPDA